MNHRGLSTAMAMFFLAFAGPDPAAASPDTGARVRPILMPAGLPVATYAFNIRIDPAKHHLSGVGIIDMPAAVSAREAVELELREEFTLVEVTLRDGEGSAAPTRLSRAKRGDQFIWTVRPDRPIKGGRQVRLRVSYAGGRAEASRFLYIGPEVSFANASRESWLPRPVGLPVLGRLNFSVPAGLTVASMGARTSTPDQEQAGMFRFTAHVPGEAWFAVGRYTILRRPGAYPAAVYLLKHRQGAEAYVEGCTQIIDVLSRQFGGYPYGTFSLVELPAEITAKAGGFNALGSPGAILTQGGALDAPFNLAYFGHEIGHQWWGNIITRDPSDERGDYMMDEALADLGSLLAVEAIKGPEAAERYRRTGYPGFNPDTYSAFGYLKLAAAGLDSPLSHLPDSDLSFRLARSKGGRIWFALSREIGLERFPRVAAALVRKHAFQPVTWTEFLRSISEAAGRDLGWFYADYFDRAGAPDWTLHWRKAGRGRVTLVLGQPAPGFRGHVPVETVAAEGRRSTRSVNLTGLRTSVSMAAREPVRSITLDPHFTWLRWTREYRAEAAALAGYTRGRLAEGNEAKLGILQAALADVPAADVYAVRYQIEALMGAILASAESWSEAKTHLEAAIASPTTLPERLPLTYLRLATVAKALKDDKLLDRAVAGAIATDAVIGGSTGAAKQARELLPIPGRP